MNKQAKKKQKRNEIKIKRQEEVMEMVEDKRHEIIIKELVKKDDTTRMPINFFASREEYIDDRMPLGRDKQLEIISSMGIPKRVDLR